MPVSSDVFSCDTPTSPEGVVVGANAEAEYENSVGGGKESGGPDYFPVNIFGKTGKGKTQIQVEQLPRISTRRTFDRYTDPIICLIMLGIGSSPTTTYLEDGYRIWRARNAPRNLRTPVSISK